MTYIVSRVTIQPNGDLRGSHLQQGKVIIRILEILNGVFKRKSK